jgi:hypothetical protein
MNRPYPFAIATLLVCTTLFFANCVNNLAGGTEDVNTRVVGVILNSDNTAAAGAKIHLIPSDFNPMIDTLEKVAVSGTADAKGSYCLSVPPAKATYSLEARQADGGRRLLIPDITIEGLSDTTFVDTGTLRDPCVIKVDFTGGDFPESGYLYIPGTSVSVFIDSPETGLGVIDSVAAGEIPTLCFAATASAPPDTLRRDISIVPGDTALVENPGWRYRALVRINTAAARVSADLTDFPLLVRLNGDNFDFSQCAPSGSDLRVTKTDNTPLVFEIERWDAGRDGNDAAEIWVRLDTVRADDSLQSIYLYWGRADAGSESNAASVFDTASGFRGVWHLNEDPSDGDTPMRDRTANGFHGSPLGSMTNENTVTGVIGTALKYDGVDDNVSAGELNLSGNYSLSCWINFSDLDTARRCIWKEYSYTLWYHSAVNGVRVEHFTERGIWAGFYQDGGTERAITAGSWFFLTGTYDGNRIHLFVNGTLLDSTQVITDLPVQSQEPLLLGGREGELVKGVMDEVRIENRARSPEWVRLCFENQHPNSAVVTIEK